MPSTINLYHIVHMDNLPSIISDGFLYSDAYMRERKKDAVVIGMDTIKNRRLTQPLESRPGLHVGECVPFYFCPRSPMLYMFHKSNSLDITYRGGQEPIVHLVASMHHTVEWADNNNLRWAFTDSNAGSYYFHDYADLAQLNMVNWNAVNKIYWQDCRDEKQAEFLFEHCFPWGLIEEIGVYSNLEHETIHNMIKTHGKRVRINTKREWYY